MAGVPGTATSVITVEPLSMMLYFSLLISKTDKLYSVVDSSDIPIILYDLIPISSPVELLEI